MSPTLTQLLEALLVALEDLHNAREGQGFGTVPEAQARVEQYSSEWFTALQALDASGGFCRVALIYNDGQTMEGTFSFPGLSSKPLPPSIVQALRERSGKKSGRE